MSKKKKTLLTITYLGILLGVFGYQYFKTKEMTDKLEASVKESKERSDKLYGQLIIDYPMTATAAYALFKLNKTTQAEELLNTLIKNENEPAIYLQSKLAIETELLDFPVSEAIQKLHLLCKKYFEPCITLSNYYKKSNEYDNSYKYLIIAEASNKPEVYADLMYLFSNKKWGKHNPAIAKEYAVKLENSVPLKDKECSGNSKGLFQLTMYEGKTHNNSFERD